MIVSASPVAETAGRLSSTLFERGSHTAGVQASPETRVTYSNHTLPTGTRQFPPGLPRNASHTPPSALAARRGKLGAIVPLAPAGLCPTAARCPRGRAAVVGIASITSGGVDQLFPSSASTRTASDRPVW